MQMNTFVIRTELKAKSNCSGRFRRIGLIRFGIGIATVMLASGTALAVSDLASGTVQVMQKSRSFQPGAIELQQNQVLQIMNDDGQLMHHAYVDARDFKFDSGEQAPGTTVNIQFPTAGIYVVLCGIHPKMRLNVAVR